MKPLPTRRRPLALLAMGLALLVGSDALRAAGEGRVICTVLDQSGAPIGDARIMLTLPGTDHAQGKTTSARGQATLLVRDATREYSIRIAKDGFVPVEEALKPKPEETLRVTYTLAPEPQADPSPTPSPDPSAGERSCDSARLNE